MSFLNAVINSVEDEIIRENLQDRIDIIQHKIKFMDKVEVCCLDSANNFNSEASELIAEAGGELQSDVNASRVLIYFERNVSMLELMGAVPSLLLAEWPSVTYDRVYLWDDPVTMFKDADAAVNALEDLAEMLYPGYFVFGNEGKTWMSFKTQ